MKIGLFLVTIMITLIVLMTSQSCKSDINTITTANEISLVFFGDIMLDRDVKKSVYDNFGGDYS